MLRQKEYGSPGSPAVVVATIEHGMKNQSYEGKSFWEPSVTTRTIAVSLTRPAERGLNGREVGGGRGRGSVEEDRRADGAAGDGASGAGSPAADDDDRGLAASATAKVATPSPKAVRLRSVPPTYCPVRQVLRMKFQNERVKLTSAKNVVIECIDGGAMTRAPLGHLQMPADERSADDVNIVFQLGKSRMHEYACDFTKPLSPLVGFAIALSSMLAVP